MIESVIRNYLSGALTNVPVYLEVPPDAPETYVTLEKTGSGMDNRLRTATFAIQSISGSLFNAASLNAQVIDKLLNASIANVFRVQLNSDYNFTDTTTKHRRYQAVFDITYKET